MLSRLATSWRTRLPLRASLRAPQKPNTRFASSVASKSPGRPRRDAGDRQWQEDKFTSVNAKYPLAKKLAESDIRSDPLNSTSSKLSVRTQIVSPDLCDDVLKYMGHTIEKFKGCDIIDLNPGVCLWSQKLHDFLQPRTHVLYESTPSMYSEFQQPLLDKPGSTYKLFQGEFARNDSFDKLYESGILPHQKPREGLDLEARKPNDTLLVTGSLMWDPPAKGISFDSMGKQIFTLSTVCAWESARYHRYGPVRSLLWLVEEDLKGALPRSHYVYKKNAFINHYLSKLVQVVTPGHITKGSGASTIGRSPQSEITSVIRGMERGRANGMELPAHRREPIHDFADELAKRNIERGKAADATMYSEEIFPFLEQQLRAGKDTTGVDYQQNIDSMNARIAMEKDPTLHRIQGVEQAKTKEEKPKTKEEKAKAKEERAKAKEEKAKAKEKKVKTDEKKFRSGSLDEEGLRIRTQAALVRTNLKRRINQDKVADLAEALYDRECEVLAMEEGPAKEAAKEEVERMDSDLESLIENTIFMSTDFSADGNERISLKSPVPLLQWDHRPYEPLVMQEDEMWPSKRACLVDSEPHPLPPDKTANDFDWVMDFASGLLQTPNSGVRKALDTMQPGASALIDEVPSLKDPKKGGRMSMDHLKVHMLTNEMISDLCQAYREWPFKHSHATHPKYFQSRLKGWGDTSRRGKSGAHGKE